jgi:simple sugar transport system permease protein
MASIISNSAGVINIGLEGIMLFSALIGVIVSAFTQNPFAGLAGAVAAGVALSFVMAYFALNLKADIILAGIAVNLFASGGTVFILYVLTGDRGVSTSLPSVPLPTVSLPVIEYIPVIGKIFSGHNVLTYLSLLSVLALHIFLAKTKLGLRIRAVGQNPDAARSVGVKVRNIQYLALMLGGALCGMGGSYMSMGYMSWFTRDMVAGRGFIALAAQTMGNDKALPTMIASLFFGSADALANAMQVLKLPVEFVQMIPYIATIGGLCLYAYRIKTRKKAVKEGAN